MSGHVFLPGVRLEDTELLPEHAEWLGDWLRQVGENVEAGDVSSSMCLQGIMSELVLFGRARTDWLGVLQEYLTDKEPLAYSQIYGRRLYKFEGQWRQTPVHAIHAHWWIHRTLDAEGPLDYPSLIEERVQPPGWIYDPRVSPTRVRNRMKSELTMSTAMGVEILKSHGSMNGIEGKIVAALASMSMTGYLGAEYFRLKTLEAFSATEHVPTGLDAMLKECETDVGYCDFYVSSKVDDYMGTAKRFARDLAIRSPVSSLHAGHIGAYCDETVRAEVEERLRAFGEYLRENPMDIPAFRIRDLDAPFGTGLSPLEVIGASWLASGGEASQTLSG